MVGSRGIDTILLGDKRRCTLHLSNTFALGVDIGSTIAYRP